MGRKANSKREPRAAVAANAFVRPTPNWPLVGLSLVGCALAGYLSWTSLSGGSVQGCSSGSGCDVVLSSRWATLLGLPTAFWGLLTYLALAGAAFIARADQQWRLAWTIAFFGVLYSLYLTGISLTVLGGACPYCLTSLALMSAILALLTLQRPDRLPAFSWQRWLRIRGPVAVAIIAFLHLNYIGLVGKPPAQEDPTLRALAVHLAEVGVKMYGAEWCPHCQDQKAMFGSAAKRLPYVECSPAGPNAPQAPSCNIAGVQSYPTWVINGRTIVGEVLTLAQLAEASKFTQKASFN